MLGPALDPPYRLGLDTATGVATAPPQEPQDLESSLESFLLGPRLPAAPTSRRKNVSFSLEDPRIEVRV